MTPYHYRAYGLRIASALPLPELISDEHNGPADVTIRSGQVPEELENPAGQGVLYQVNPDQFLLRMDQVGRFLVQNGKEILLEPAPHSLESDLRVFLLGSCLGALLHQRGILALHASSILTDQGAILFVGHSGAGKSTLLSAFLKRGYGMLADDITGIVLDDAGKPLALPAFPRVKLWADSVKRLGHDKQALSRVRPQQEKYELPTRDQFVIEPASLAGVYHLTTNNKDELELEEVDNVWRLGVLVNNTYRMRFLDGLEMRPSHFKLTSTVASQIPVTRVTRPSQPNRLDALVDMIEEHFCASVETV